MTTTITIGHTDATRLLKELTALLEDKNLDTLQIVTTSTDIHVVKLGDARNNDILNLDEAGKD